MNEKEDLRDEDGQERDGGHLRDEDDYHTGTVAKQADRPKWRVKTYHHN